MLPPIRPETISIFENRTFSHRSRYPVRQLQGCALGRYRVLYLGVELASLKMPQFSRKGFAGGFILTQYSAIAIALIPPNSI